MIELRWIYTQQCEGSKSGSIPIGQRPQAFYQTLQYRTKIQSQVPYQQTDGGMISQSPVQYSYEWSEWKDVPVEWEAK